MKQLIVLSAFLAASAAHATQVQIASVDLVWSTGSTVSDLELAGHRFEVNAEMGRARIEVSYVATYTGGYDDAGPAAPANSRVMVPGLTFDAERSEVVYKNADGKVTPCALVKLSDGIFRRTKVKNTGLCTISSEVKDIATDDGWEVRHRKVLNVFLNVRD